MNIKSLITDKSIWIGVLLIILCYLLSDESSSIPPFIFITGILLGLINKDSMNELLVKSTIMSFIGSLIAAIISVVVVYYSYGGLSAASIIYPSLFYIVIYMIIGIAGSAAGYYFNEELRIKTHRE